MMSKEREQSVITQKSKRHLGFGATVIGGATLASLTLLAAACGGNKGEGVSFASPTPPDTPNATEPASIPTVELEDGIKGGTQLPPTQTEIVPTTILPTIEFTQAPTPEATSVPEATPEMTLEQAITELDSIIAKLQSPEIAQDYEQTAWQIQLTTILDGVGDPDLERPGLNDVRDALIVGNIELARNRMTHKGVSIPPRGVIFASMTNPSDLQSGAMEPLIKWTSVEIDQYDPERVFISSDSASFRVPQARLDLTIDFLTLYYGLKSLAP